MQVYNIVHALYNTKINILSDSLYAREYLVSNLHLLLRVKITLSHKKLRINGKVSYNPLYDIIYDKDIIFDAFRDIVLKPIAEQYVNDFGISHKDLNILIKNAPYHNLYPEDNDIINAINDISNILLDKLVLNHYDYTDIELYPRDVTINNTEILHNDVMVYITVQNEEITILASETNIDMDMIVKLVANEHNITIGHVNPKSLDLATLYLHDYKINHGIEKAMDFNHIIIYKDADYQKLIYSILPMVIKYDIEEYQFIFFENMDCMRYVRNDDITFQLLSEFDYEDTDYDAYKYAYDITKYEKDFHNIKNYTLPCYKNYSYINYTDISRLKLYKKIGKILINKYSHHNKSMCTLSSINNIGTTDLSHLSRKTARRLISYIRFYVNRYFRRNHTIKDLLDKNIMEHINNMSDVDIMDFMNNIMY